MPGRRAYLFWVLAAGVLSPFAADSGEPVKTAAAKDGAAKAETPPDDELFEFLGSVDTGDDDWIDYLAGTDIAQAAKAKPARSGSEVKKDE